jgi:hypothetical protein
MPHSPGVLHPIRVRTAQGGGAAQGGPGRGARFLEESAAASIAANLQLSDLYVSVICVVVT